MQAVFYRQGKYYNETPKETVAKIVELFNDKQKSIDEVAQETGVSRTTVHKYWARHYSVEECEKRHVELCKYKDGLRMERGERHRNNVRADRKKMILDAFHSDKSTIQVAIETGSSEVTVRKYWRETYGYQAFERRTERIHGLRKLQSH